MFSYRMTNNVNKAIEAAARLAASLGEDKVGTEHLLYGLSKEIIIY